MKVVSLYLENFRNIEKTGFDLSGGVNVFYGRNAQGKTNLLESIYVFTSGKSFRPAKDKELIMHDKEKAVLNMTFFAENRNNEYDIIFYSDKRRREAKINGVPIKRNMDMAGNFYTVLFAPEHLNLIKEGPGERRRFLDQAISVLKPKYAKAVEDYEKILTQKNALLKDIYKYPQLEATLDVWSEKQANVGAYLMFMRNSYIKKLGEIARKDHLELSNGKEELKLSYIHSGKESENEFYSLEATRSFLAKEISDMKNEEISAGMSLVGPQRDDMEVTVNQMSAKMFCSQGQQRSAVLSIKMAEGDLVYETTGEQPVMLLDDMLSELDRPRQTYILKKITDRQVIITGCDRARYKNIDNVKFFNIKNGTIIEC
ncbi:MAG: DNA replication/repair protein RecF [Clostridia bacterium]|nr:DNA replication/repair protein RecF [Clostridia bacterium]